MRSIAYTLYPGQAWFLCRGSEYFLGQCTSLFLGQCVAVVAKIAVFVDNDGLYTVNSNAYNTVHTLCV